MSYAPKSPDLSGFYSADPDPTPPAPAPGPKRHSQQHLQPSSNSYYSPAPLHPPPPPQPQQQHPAHVAADPPYQPYEYNLPQYVHPQHAQDAAQAPLPADHQQQYGPQTYHHPQPPYAASAHPQQFAPSTFYQPPTHPAPLGPPQLHAQGHPHNPAGHAPTLDTNMPPRKGAQAVPATPVIEPSPVRTKFPTARIKRIMQADEEVGKVAQQTPIAVGKALELFMISLVTKSAEVARDKNSKRVSAQMLKQVVETDDQFDFLRDIVSKVENDEKKAGGRAKAETDSDEEAEPRKKGKGGRKKKAT